MPSQLLSNVLTQRSVNETSELRWDYGDPELGTCQETIKGGNHFRYWVQDGSQADRFVVHRPWRPGMC